MPHGSSSMERTVPPNEPLIEPQVVGKTPDIYDSGMPSCVSLASKSTGSILTVFLNVLLIEPSIAKIPPEQVPLIGADKVPAFFEGSI
ncbi:MAG: hypothetical protein A4E64_00168 [Syntrophorhabdus sp. PtaU1.Bin058]|nr:MAG: hypothetical protein A4E64_00168 [Syntrophorhabdus sp. PtaU1.Bin058]